MRDHGHVCWQPVGQGLINMLTTCKAVAQVLVLEISDGRDNQEKYS